jgi:hypothetical protein
MKTKILSLILALTPALALAQMAPPNTNPAAVKPGTYQVEPVIRG